MWAKLCDNRKDIVFVSRSGRCCQSAKKNLRSSNSPSFFNRWIPHCGDIEAASDAAWEVLSLAWLSMPRLDCFVLHVYTWENDFHHYWVILTSLTELCNRIAECWCHFREVLAGSSLWTISSFNRLLGALPERLSPCTAAASHEAGAAEVYGEEVEHTLNLSGHLKSALWEIMNIVYVRGEKLGRSLQEIMDRVVGFSKLFIYIYI